MTDGLRVGAVATRAGVHVETLRYYERRGLLPSPDRTLGGHRLYPVETVARLRMIKAAQRLGFTLREVADLVDAGLHRHRRRSDPGLQARMGAKLSEIDARIADLEAIRTSLRAAVSAGCDDLTTCAGTPCCPLPFTDLAGGGGVDAAG